MVQVINSWKNRAGQTIVEHETGLKVIPSGWTPERWLGIQERREAGRRAAQATDRLVGEIERELAKPENRNVVARLDTETGEVTAFMATPTAPGSTEDPAELPLHRLSATKRRELELQRDALRAIADDKGSSERTRRIAGIDAGKIEALLKLDGAPPGRITLGVYPTA